MPSPEQTENDPLPDEDGEVSEVHEIGFSMDLLDPEIREQAEATGQHVTPVHEEAAIVGEGDQPRTLIYKTMHHAHEVPDLTEEEAREIAEEARNVLEIWGGKDN